MPRFRKHGNTYHLSSSKDYQGETVDYLSFWFGWRFNLTYDVCGYFDNRPRLDIGFIFFTLIITFPFRNKWEDESDPPQYGIAIHDNTFWLYKGGKGNGKGGTKWWTWYFPFITKNWIRTSILLKDNTWEHERPGKRKEFWNDEWKEKQMSWTYDYTDKYDGEVIPTTIYVEEREWRPKWLGWTSLFATKRKTIDVHFSKECGEEKGSWKGGSIGCSYDLKNGEEPLDCLKRMEKEREF